MTSLLASINCPLCKEAFPQKLNRLRSGSRVACPVCGETIHFTSAVLRQVAAQARRQLKD